MLDKILKRVKNKGLIETAKYAYSKIDKKARLQDEIDTLHFYLNQITDIRKFPQAEGSLRDIQVGDTYLLDIFDAVCQKFNLTYWISFGTLLGAVRHGGVIPWDDDVDVCMIRFDYDNSRDKIKKFLNKYGINFYTDDSLARLGIGYKHEETGIWMDIFPADYYSVTDNEYDNFLKTINKYGRFYLKGRGKKSNQSLLHKKNILLEQYQSDREGNIVVEAFEVSRVLPHIGTPQCVISYSDIFPLKKITFENIEVCCPNNSASVLKTNYGKNFDKYPKVAVPHHGDDNGKLWQWASKSNIDMEKTLKELRSIAIHIRNDD